MTGVNTSTSTGSSPTTAILQRHQSQARQEYLRTHTTPGALRAGFAYYRSIGEDIADNEARTEKLTMPTLAVGGGTSWGRGPEVAKSLRQMATDVTEEIYDECGHWVPEEKLIELANTLRRSSADPQPGHAQTTSRWHHRFRRDHHTTIERLHHDHPPHPLDRRPRDRSPTWSSSRSRRAFTPTRRRSRSRS